MVRLGPWLVDSEEKLVDDGNVEVLDSSEEVGASVEEEVVGSSEADVSSAEDDEDVGSSDEEVVGSSEVEVVGSSRVEVVGSSEEDKDVGSSEGDEDVGSSEEEVVGSTEDDEVVTTGGSLVLDSAKDVLELLAGADTDVEDVTALTNLYRLTRFSAPQVWVGLPAQGKTQSPSATFVLPSETAPPQRHSRPFVTANRRNLAAWQKAPQLSTVISSDS